MKYIFDLETNGLDPDKIWCMVIQDIDTEELFSFSDYDKSLPDLSEGLNKLNKAKIISGHNIIGYDLPVLKKLCGWVPDKPVQIWDTYVMSQLCKYQRGHRHGLAGWGDHFKYPKGDFEDWSQYSKEMLEYCVRDVELNTRVYKQLSKEVSYLISKDPLFIKGLRLEQDFLAINSRISSKGWVFNKEKALSLIKEITLKMTVIEQDLEPKLGSICLLYGTKEIDKLIKKNGEYYKLVTDWYDLDPDTKASEGFIRGPFSRIEFKDTKLGQIAEVKKFLLDNGWKPDDWTVKKINGHWIKQSPKLTETSLDKLGDLGQKVGEYYMLRNRLGTLEGWLDHEKDGRLQGQMFTIGTPSFRCRHKIIVNLPRVQSDYGLELRSLLTCEPGYKVVGGDSKGNQMRGLCHYIGDDKFTQQVINGDVHQVNADILGIPRDKAKNFIYAYIFGAGFAKLGEVISGKKSVKIGKSADNKFKKALPGLQRLKENLSDEFSKALNGTGVGFIRGIDGRRIIAGSQHQLLNYLLQTLEGVTCKASMIYADNKITEEGIDAYPILFMHDEQAWVVKEEEAERVKDILAESFKEAPKDFGVMIMDGNGTIGDTYADVH